MSFWKTAMAVSVLAGYATAGHAQMPSPEEARCTALYGMAITPDQIGAPSGGADIYSATLVRGDQAAGGGFCKVNGGVDPVDPAAPDINFQINLPLEWNAKAIQFGGGGYNGSLINAEGNVSFGADSAATPLQRGYASFGSDSGHQGAILDGRFAMNDEALDNFGGAQIKKTHDVAMAVIAAFYGTTPERVYIQGNSQGGHEALIGIQRWPDDYHGAIVTHPANPFSALQLSGNFLGKAFYQPGGYINPAKVELLNGAVTQACDGLDGLEDGVIGNTAACDAQFDISTLRCESGEDEGDGCFSDTQIKVLNLINTDYVSPVPLADGAPGFPRWPVFQGGDLYGLWGFGFSPEVANPPAPVANFGLAVLADPLIRYAILRDPDTDTMDFEPAEHADRVTEVSRIIDANSPDLSAFTSRGGKVLLMHGTTDFAISPYNTVAYYQRLVETMGADRVQDFLRFYLVPGFGHGSGRFIAAWDPLTALENWVEADTAPEGLVVSDAGPDGAGRSRPMCEYPGFPAFDGVGDPGTAASFTCTQ